MRTRFWTCPYCRFRIDRNKYLRRHGLSIFKIKKHYIHCEGEDPRVKEGCGSWFKVW
jgi:hypothetical protein